LSLAANADARRFVCLVYHDVVPETAAGGGGPERFSVPLRMFERMLDAIRREGFAGCSLEAALAAPGTRRVAITFDDANAGQFEHAVPALRARGMTATIYVVANWVGRPGFMTWDQLRQAREWGMSVQSHTCTHPFLSELDEPALRRELADSKAILDRELGQDTRELAFPGGDPPRRSLRHLPAELGFTVMAGTRWGVNSDPASPGRIVRRCTVRGNISEGAARRFVQGDPWLALARRPREAALRGIRGALGPSRYARWRRHFLDAVS
jgi:peptidoglycan/xylan/chitin deacetylase (PgdA/CDA1 family)